MSRFLRTLAATPEPSLTRPRRICSVPMYSWLKRCASWLASCITLRARSVKRSYIPAVSACVTDHGARRETVAYLWDCLWVRYVPAVLDSASRQARAGGESDLVHVFRPEARPRPRP